jgi:hypothetical protein
LAASLCSQAQSAHYPAGVEGLKAATLPPPGFYLRDYNYFYTSDELPGGPPDFDLTAYIQAPRLVWISPYNILGGAYGADVLVPFVYQDVTQGGKSDSEFGLGDLFIEPITLSWHIARFDVAVGYGAWAPTGDFDAAKLSPGKGFWTHMLTAGATWYADAGKTWSISALNRYEISHENDDTGITPGQAWTLEGGIGKAITPALELGVVGYYQLQTTTDDGPGAGAAKDHAAAVGPEINLAFPKIMLFASARYFYEFDAENRPEGHTANITITKRF